MAVDAVTQDLVHDGPLTFLAEHLMPPKFAKLAGLGALGATAGLIGVYLLFLFGTRPGTYAGMDGVNRSIAWLSVGGVIVALIAVHVVLGMQLLAIGRGERGRI